MLTIKFKAHHFFTDVAKGLQRWLLERLGGLRIGHVIHQRRYDFRPQVLWDLSRSNVRHTLSCWAIVLCLCAQGPDHLHIHVCVVVKINVPELPWPVVHYDQMSHWGGYTVGRVPRGQKSFLIYPTIPSSQRLGTLVALPSAIFRGWGCLSRQWVGFPYALLLLWR